MAWFETWFDTPYYHILYKDRDFAEAEYFITKLVAELRLPENSKIIDLACGKGRHSIFLNKLGYKVLGVDLSKQSIEHNKSFESDRLKFAVHDMRDEIFGRLTSEKVDAVVNLFTSFGYFDTEAEDRAVFTSVSNCLKDGGYFVLDFLNETFVKNTLIKETKTEKEGIKFHITKKIKDKHVLKNIKFRDGGREFEFSENVKLHTLEDIENFAQEAGFITEKIFGDYLLGAFDKNNSPRCIHIFRKK